MTATQARAIYQDLLELIVTAMEQDRYDLYQTYFALPHRIETLEARDVISTPAELRRFFDTLRTAMVDAGNSQMIRYCTAAVFDNPHTIHGSHESRLVGHGNQIEATYFAYSILHLQDGQWRVASSQYAGQDERFINDVFKKLRR